MTEGLTPHIAHNFDCRTGSAMPLFTPLFTKILTSGMMNRYVFVIVVTFYWDIYIYRSLYWLFLGVIQWSDFGPCGIKFVRLKTLPRSLLTLPSRQKVF